ncbi:MAG: hypothetical protein RBT49_03265 [Bacteroidales bacterium]|jgi:hypothetical protein|nr:hypothetical protein [Bacteroidales bacterium]
MEKKIIVTALLIALLTVVFSMSGDGENVPVKVSKELKHETSNVNIGQPAQDDVVSNKEKSNETINKYSDPVPYEECGLKVHFNPKGIYASEKFKSPGQPEGEELERLYQKYKSEFLNSGFKAKGIISVLFYNKINLNTIEEFKTMGVDLFELDNRKFENINNREAILYSKICITGTVVDSISNPDPKSSYHTLYKIKVDKMYKGSEYYKEIPETINYYSPVGKVLIGGTREMNMHPRARTIEHIGEKVCLGLIQNLKIEMKLDSVSFDVIKFLESEDFVKRFEEINSSENFFKEVSK